jgi:hypothetical protein
MSDMRLPVPVSGLSQVIRRALKSYGETVHTAMPAQVVSYSAATKQVNVQPVLDFDLLIGGQLQPQKLPVIYNVPVVFPGSSKFCIQWDLVKGDGVLLIFSEASIDKWKSGSGGETDPGDTRRFALSDAVAIPGLFSFGNPGQVGQTGGMDIVNNAENKAEIFLSDSGEIQLNAGTTNPNAANYVECDATTDETNWPILTMLAAMFGLTLTQLSGKLNTKTVDVQ